MKTSIFFKQDKPLTVKILGLTIVVFTIIAIWENVAKLSQIIILFSIGIVLLGYSFSFEINETNRHKKHFKLFGITLFKTNLDFFTPEYVTVFLASINSGSDWGPISAIGKEVTGQNYVVRVFKGNQHFTLWRTKSKHKALHKAEGLAALLTIDSRF